MTENNDIENKEPLQNGKGPVGEHPVDAELPLNEEDTKEIEVVSDELPAHPDEGIEDVVEGNNAPIDSPPSDESNETEPPEEEAESDENEDLNTDEENDKESSDEEIISSDEGNEQPYEQILSSDVDFEDVEITDSGTTEGNDADLEALEDDVFLMAADGNNFPEDGHPKLDEYSGDWWGDVPFTPLETITEDEDTQPVLISKDNDEGSEVDEDVNQAASLAETRVLPTQTSGQLNAEMNEPSPDKDVTPVKGSHIASDDIPTIPPPNVPLGWTPENPNLPKAVSEIDK
jgi:hypothetical protein